MMKKRNPIAVSLKSGTFKAQKIQPRKGRGSYTRKNRKDW